MPDFAKNTPEKKKSRKRQYSLPLPVRILLVVIIVVSLISFATAVMKYNKRMNEKKELEARKAELQSEKEELLELKDAKEDDNYIVRIARKIWHLFYPDEEIIYSDRND